MGAGVGAGGGGGGGFVPIWRITTEGDLSELGGHRDYIGTVVILILVHTAVPISFYGFAVHW